MLSYGNGTLRILYAVHEGLTDSERVSRDLTEEIVPMAPTPPRSPGIYQILCIPNGKIYIGSAIDLRARWEQHRHSLRRRDHRNRHLQQAWDKYGESNFEFSVLLDFIHFRQRSTRYRRGHATSHPELE
jgi:hypothetical protein